MNPQTAYDEYSMSAYNLRDIRRNHLDGCKDAKVVASAGILRTYFQASEPVMQELVAPSSQSAGGSAAAHFASGHATPDSIIKHRKAAVERVKAKYATGSTFQKRWPLLASLHRKMIRPSGMRNRYQVMLHPPTFSATHASRMPLHTS